MVRTSEEGRARPLTDSESIAAGDGTLEGSDGVDIDTGEPGGVIAPPASDVIKFIPDSAAWDGVLDFLVARFYDVTLTEDLDAVLIANVPATGLLGRMEVTYRQGPGGGFTAAHPDGTEWRDTDGTGTGLPPTLSTAEGAQDTIRYDARDGTGEAFGGSYDGASGSSSPEEEFVEHGSMGSTEAFDPDAGDAHTGTIDDDCTATILAPAGDGPIQMEWWITADGDGHVLTIDATGGTVIGDTPPASVDGETYRLVLDRIPDSTNDWVVNLVGSSGAAAIEIDDEGTPLTTSPTSIDFVGAGVTATAVGDDVTLTIPGTPTGAAGGDLSGTYPNPSVVDDSHSHTSATLPASGSAHYLTIASSHSTPLVFDDIVQSSAGNDFIYSS